MNAVEIEEAVSALVEQPFDAAEFPYAFLAAFGNKETTLRRLRTGTTNQSDVGGVLQRNNIHLAVAAAGAVSATLAALRASPATARQKARFILATDGEMVEAEDLESGDPLACAWGQLPDHFGFFLPLAGITTVRQIRENAFDIRATSKLNKLYVELLKTNPAWGTDERRPDMNHFMARLIFSFFAEDTGIIPERGHFTETVSTMSAADSSNTHEVIAAVFRAMNTPVAERSAAGIPRWAGAFPYVNGGLFAGAIEVPRFSRIARSYLLQVGALDWTQVNPDIFGSMIQAVADDEERGALGMHYTSVPNILKVLNPLFLDELRAKLAEAGDNPRTLLNLRKRLARIRVFDPACGSGNFLVIAYKQLREIEAEINKRRKEPDRRSEIPLTNFRGIELRDFAAEIARLALIIAEFQCDALYRGQQEAIRDFLPLSAENWIICGNALRLDWLSVCPPTGTAVKLAADDLFSTPLDQTEIDFGNVGGETYLCGNPPYQGSVNQTAEQKRDLELVMKPISRSYKDLDYVAAFIARTATYLGQVDGRAGLVATNSICQGEQVAMLWPPVLAKGIEIVFAHTSFPWSNNATHNAGVTCVILGLGIGGEKHIYSDDSRRIAQNISPYLIDAPSTVVVKRQDAISALPRMVTGNMPSDGGHLIMSATEARHLASLHPEARQFLRWFAGAEELINGGERACLWISDEDVSQARKIADIDSRLSAVRTTRMNARSEQARSATETPNRFVFSPHREGLAIAVPKTSSARRRYIPCVLTDDRTVLSDAARVIYGAEPLILAILASTLHVVWIGAVCGKLKTDYRYSHTLGWNTFPVPALTEKNKADLTRCAEDILLAREVHYPATIADLYDPDTMPANLRDAHERNDEVLERIYIGRRFKNDTERLEKLFAMYTEMTAREQRPTARRRSRA